MAADRKSRNLGEMTQADWEASSPGEQFRSDNVLSPDFKWVYAEEAFLSRGGRGTVDMTCVRQEFADFARNFIFRGVAPDGALNLEVQGIENRIVATTVAQIRMPLSTTTDLAIALVKFLYGSVDQETDARLKQELTAIIQA